MTSIVLQAANIEALHEGPVDFLKSSVSHGFQVFTTSLQNLVCRHTSHPLRVAPVVLEFRIRLRCNSFCWFNYGSSSQCWFWLNL